MSKVEQCWVIQRDDGMYLNLDDLTWYKKAWQASMTWSKSGAEHEIAIWQLQNCRPVKIEIRVIGKDYEQKKI